MKKNVDDTPAAPTRKSIVPLSDTPIPQDWHLWHTYVLLDITQGEDEKVVEEQAICLESKVMNPNDEDCCDEEG